MPRQTSPNGRPRRRTWRLQTPTAATNPTVGQLPASVLAGYFVPAANPGFIAYRNANPDQVPAFATGAHIPGLRYRPFTAENPITMHAHTGNASLQTWTLDYAPVSAVKTSLISNRVALAVSSVSTTAPYSVTTSASAPITGASIVTVYEFAA